MANMDEALQRMLAHPDGICLNNLRECGFDGFATVRHLWDSRSMEIPAGPGIYVVFRSERGPIRFKNQSPGCTWKGKSPTMPLPYLETRLAMARPMLPLLYVGCGTSLRKRLKDYFSFGHGKPAAHWGGRLIWQIERADSLRVAWCPDADPFALEKTVLRLFKREFGALPFANLRI